MRKITTLVLLLIAFVTSTIAQVSIDTNKKYYLKSKDRGYLTGNPSNNATLKGQTSKNGAFVWTFVEVNGKYQLINQNNLYLTKTTISEILGTGSFNLLTLNENAPTNGWTLAPSNTTDYFVLFDADTQTQLHLLNEENSYAVANWGYDSNGSGSGARLDDAGCQFKIEDIYIPNYTGQRGGSYPNRFITNIELNGDNLTISATEKTQYYVDKTGDKTFTVRGGDSITINLEIGDASWMHSYVYIDKGNDGFTAELDNNNYSPLEDLVSYSAYNFGNENYRNSLGERVNAGSSLNEIPTFTAPTEPGLYRMRYKMDWSSEDPNGTEDFKNNSGFIVDFMLEVISPLSSRTITVNTEATDCIVKANGNIGETTAESEITLTAEAAWGYEFEKWTLNGESVSTNATYIDATNGNKEYIAIFRRLTADEQYAKIAKPTVGSFNNPSFVNYATISNGSGVAYINKNIIPADQIKKGQNGSSVMIPVAKGANFDLDLKFMLNWGDLSIVKIEKGVEERMYERINGSWPDYSGEKVLEQINNLGINIAEDNTVSLPITINENSTIGDVFVVRIVFANGYELRQQAISDASFFDFCFEVVPSHTLTVSSAGIATMFLDNAVAIPPLTGNDCGVYIVKNNGLKDNYITLTPIEGGIIPANTGVIVKSNAGSYNFVYTSETSTENLTGNLLKGTTIRDVITREDDYEYYVLWNHKDYGVGLYVASASETETTGAFWNDANKAYLRVPKTKEENASLSAFYGFRIGTTAIEEVVVENNENVIYDLQGRRVSEITKAGIYIVNGHKVLVK